MNSTAAHLQRRARHLPYTCQTAAGMPHRLLTTDGGQLHSTLKTSPRLKTRLFCAGTLKSPEMQFGVGPGQGAVPDAWGSDPPLERKSRASRLSPQCFEAITFTPMPRL